jgi:hypothetical protein
VAPRLTHVPYKAEAAVHSDLFGDLLDFAWANPSTARAQVQGGKMKVLGIAGTRRVSTMPNVPTFAEQGFQGFDVDSWIGLYAPARLPADVQAAWVTALREITAMPDVQARLTGYGFEPLGNTPAQFMQVFTADYPRVAELIKAAGVTAAIRTVPPHGPQPLKRGPARDPHRGGHRHRLWPAGSPRTSANSPKWAPARPWASCCAATGTRSAWPAMPATCRARCACWAKT